MCDGGALWNFPGLFIPFRHAWRRIGHRMRREVVLTYVRR
jgi:hypothetical protein